MDIVFPQRCLCWLEGNVTFSFVSLVGSRAQNLERSTSTETSDSCFHVNLWKWTVVLPTSSSPSPSHQPIPPSPPDVSPAQPSSVQSKSHAASKLWCWIKSNKIIHYPNAVTRMTNDEDSGLMWGEASCSKCIWAWTTLIKKNNQLRGKARQQQKSTVYFHNNWK